MTIRKFKIIYVTCVPFLLDSNIIGLLILYLSAFSSGHFMMGLPLRTDLVILGLKVSFKLLGLLYLVYLSKWELFMLIQGGDEENLSFFLFSTCLPLKLNLLGKNMVTTLPCDPTVDLSF